MNIKKIINTQNKYTQNNLFNLYFNTNSASIYDSSWASIRAHLFRISLLTDSHSLIFNPTLEWIIKMHLFLQISNNQTSTQFLNGKPIIICNSNSLLMLMHTNNSNLIRGISNTIAMTKKMKKKKWNIIITTKTLSLLILRKQSNCSNTCQE